MYITKNSVDIDPASVTSKVMKYSIERNTWTNDVCDVPKAMVHHSATACADIVYVAGGRVGALSEDSSNLYAYAAQLQGNLWLCKAQMHHMRSIFNLQAANNDLYACGGACESEPVTNIEVYSVANDQWTVLEDVMLKHCVYSSTFVLGTDLYVIGGRQRKNNGWVNKDTVTCIDTTQNKVSFDSSVPFTCAYHVCVVLTAPRK